MSEEIFYLVAYDKQEKKWRSADEILGVFVNALGGDGPVRVIHEDNSIEWRDIEDGLEKDVDFDNVTTLTEFLRIENLD
jgi:hypothetical protein